MIALVVGHTDKSKGAKNVFSGLREYDFYSEVVKEFENDDNFDIYTHNSDISGYTTRIKDTAKRINEKDYEVVVSLHFNSFSKETANGCTTLYYGMSENGRRYAHIFSNTVRELANVKLRNYGANALMNKNDRGFAMVFYPKAPTILIEPFFGSNLSDCKKVGICEIAEIIREFSKKVG